MAHFVCIHVFAAPTAVCVCVWRCGCAEWEEALKKQFGLACNTVEGVWVSGYEQRIPLVLVELRKQLVGAGGLTTEGIFRIAPDAVACANVKKQLDTGTFTSCTDPHICANLIKVWFRGTTPYFLLLLLVPSLSTSLPLSFIPCPRSCHLTAHRLPPRQTCLRICSLWSRRHWRWRATRKRE
jgi:hypothetical protein